MNRADFLKCEFEMLRREIEQSKDRMFKLAIGGIIGLPSAYSVAEKINIEVLIYSVPLLIGTILFLFLSESSAVMRAGRYIREKIEPNIVDTETAETLKGWEQWLEEHPPHHPTRRRRADRFLIYFFYILFVFYYIASVVLAVKTAREHYQAVGLAASLAIYILFGILGIAFLCIIFKHLTSTLKQTAR